MCGREICCTSFLQDFVPVTVKMAKNQVMALDPSKISGVCGRLMCCFAYEHGIYEELKKHMPKVGKKVQTELGTGKVKKQNILEQLMTVELEDGNEVEVKADGEAPDGIFRVVKKIESTLGISNVHSVGTDWIRLSPEAERTALPRDGGQRLRIVSALPAHSGIPNRPEAGAAFNGGSDPVECSANIGVALAWKPCLP